LALSGLDEAEAAKKKTAPPSPPKPIYLAPMRVVIVRNSDPKCEPTCPQWIAAEGEIMPSTPQAFRKAFKQMGKAKLPIIIRSPGGSIEAALEIGRMIRERDLTVAVGQTNFRGCAPDDKSCKLPKEVNGIYDGAIAEDYAFCNSACPMLLSGGTTRLIGYQASAGVHQPSTTWTREYVRYREYYKIIKGKKRITNRKILSRKNVYDKTTYGLSKRLRKSLGAYYKSMGIDLAILDETEKAKFQDMNYLTQNQTDSLKLRTTPLSATFLSAPKLCGTTSTSAVCILDKSRDPALLLERVMAEAGLTSMTPEMTFRLAHLKGSDCLVSCPAWIAAEGVITTKTPAAFSDFLKATAVTNLAVVLHSQGGDLRAAIALGEEIKSRNLDTSIAQTVFEPVSHLTIDHSKPSGANMGENGICQGACILAFVGGQNREAARGANVTLHNPTVYEKIAGSFTAIIDMNIHLHKMGVAPTFMSVLHDIKRNKPKQFQKSELLTYAVATDARDFGELYKPDHCKVTIHARGCFSLVAKPDTQKVAAAPLLEGRFTRMTFQHFRNSDPMCEPKCPSWIFAQGRIERNSLKDLKASLTGLNPENTILVLDSPVGDETEALAMGSFVHQSKMHTTVGVTVSAPCPDGKSTCPLRSGTISKIDQGICEGECVLLFVAGRERILTNQHVLMPKGLADDGEPINFNRNAAIERYLRENSISDYFLKALKDLISWHVHPLTTREALSSGLVSRTVPSISELFQPKACKSPATALYCR
jgi:hypothetical protein